MFVVPVGTIQRQSLLNTLRLGKRVLPPWRILVYDDLGKQVLQQHFSREALRDSGITLTLSLEASREKVPDIRALYLCEFSEKSCAIIQNDISQRFYGSVDLAFLGPVEEETLKKFAKSLHSTSGSSICSATMGLPAFIPQSLQNFSIAIPHCITTFYKSSHDEVQVIYNLVLNRLASVFLTLKERPSIRYQQTPFCKKLALNLDTLLSQYQNELGMQTNRILVLADRSVDIYSPLQHPTTYGSLCQDILKILAGNIHLDDTTYQLGIEDELWNELIDINMADAAERIQSEFRELITTKNSVSESTELGADALKEINNRKYSLNIHTAISSAIIDGTDTDSLNRALEAEESITTGSVNQIISVINEFIRPSNLKIPTNLTNIEIQYLLKSADSAVLKGQTGFDDVFSAVRLAIMLRLSGEENLSKLAIAYCRRILRAGLSQNVRGTETSTAKQLVDSLSNLLDRFSALTSFEARSDSVITGLTGSVGNVVNSGLRTLKSLLPGQQRTPGMNFLNQCIEGNNTIGTTGPAISREGDILFFMIGSGSVSEAASLKVAAKRAGKVLEYGCCDFASPVDRVLEVLSVISSS